MVLLASMMHTGDMTPLRRTAATIAVAAVALARMLHSPATGDCPSCGGDCYDPGDGVICDGTGQPTLT